MFDTCAGALATTRNFFQLHGNHSVVSFEKDFIFFQDMVPSLFKLYENQVLCLNSDKTGKEEVFKAKRFS